MQSKGSDYRDKVSKQFALVLSEVPCNWSISALRDATGVLTKCVFKKLDIPVDYFQRFYSLEELDGGRIMEFLDNLTLPRLSEEHTNMLEAPIHQEKIMGAIKGLKMNSAPGPDGFALEFY